MEWICEFVKETKLFQFKVKISTNYFIFEKVNFIFSNFLLIIFIEKNCFVNFIFKKLLAKYDGFQLFYNVYCLKKVTSYN